MIESFGIIAVSGPDAEKFLQGLTTNDIRQVNSQSLQLGCFCNLKGRVIASFQIFRKDEIFYLILPFSMLEITQSHLKKYSLFSKVFLQDVSQEMQQQVLNLSGEFNAWHLAKIEAGIATIFPATSELFTPHMLNYPELGAISFDKGCYLGQEIIARTHYLGKTKRHVVKENISTANNSKPGDKITNERNEEIGCIVDLAFSDPKTLRALILPT